jgi:hydroxymethylpyrimidine/phosphomethylpyrimidine kinase
MYKVLTIAGSDSGGGAGIQADLKTFAALEVYGTSAITAITAQNSLGVTGVQAIEPEMVRRQIEAVLSDIGADAVKIGMVANAANAAAIAAELARFQTEKIVLDPVCVSTTGHSLIEPEAVQALITELFPLAMVVTPNLPEAERLSGLAIQTEAAMEEAAVRLQAFGSKYILIKGGHFGGAARDLFYDGREFTWLEAERIETQNTHGTGCTLSSAIAAYLAKGLEPLEAARKAKEYLTEAIRHSFVVGKGPGPVHHFYAFWK